MRLSSNYVLLLLVAAAAAIAGGASAHDAITLRRKIMKAVGAAAKEANEMAKGQRAFDARRAASQMTLVARSWGEVTHLFPKGSEAGSRTRAAPEIWASFKDFDEQGVRMADAAAKAAAAAGDGLEAFRTAFEPVAASCKGCHKVYMTRD